MRVSSGALQWVLGKPVCAGLHEGWHGSAGARIESCRENTHTWQTHRGAAPPADPGICFHGGHWVASRGCLAGGGKAAAAAILRR